MAREQRLSGTRLQRRRTGGGERRAEGGGRQDGAGGRGILYIWVRIHNRLSALPQPVARPSLSLYLSELTRVCALADAAPARRCVEALRTGTLMEDRRFQRHPYTPTLP